MRPGNHTRSWTERFCQAKHHFPNLLIALLLTGRSLQSLNGEHETHALELFTETTRWHNQSYQLAINFKTIIDQLSLMSRWLQLSSQPATAFEGTDTLCHSSHRSAGLHESLQPCSRAARKWRENEEMRRKWRENEEMERDWLSTFPHSLSISSLFLHFLPLFPFPTSKCVTFCCKMLNTALLSRMSQKSQHTRYEEIILGRTCCEEAPQFVPACTAHILTIPVVCQFGHFVICIFLAFASNFFITSKWKVNLLVATSKLRLNLPR